MPAPKIKTTATDALVGIWTITLTAFVVATLYFGQDLLIPLALSALLTFLLSPLVTRIERWIGRIAAVLVVVALIFTGLGAAGWMLTRQLVDLATKLPEYKGNIITKMHAFQIPKGGAFTKLAETVEELKNELPGGTAPPVPTITQEPGKPDTVVASPPSPPPTVVPVQVLETSKANPLELVQLIVAPLLGPLGMAALVLLLVICMLFQREDLRSRLIRLIGQGRISATTRALDDAGHRVSRYLLMQLLVNVVYGTVIAIGLYFIGVPNAMLWGAFGTILRFIPYIGPWIACAFPTILSLAVSPSWRTPVLTLLLFGGLELILNNVMEPLLYGSHTGISSIALIVAAVFWTWLWGPLGLVLATPLTVCLVVMGRYVPRLAFLSVLLSDEEALTPAQDCYHRLLTVGEQDEMELVETYLKTHSLTALYDNVLIPVITAAETDARLELLDQEQLNHVEQSLRDMLEDLGSRPATAFAADQGANGDMLPALVPATCRVYCLPARADRDELAGTMLTQLLQRQGFEAQNAPGKLVAGELLGVVEKADVDAVCLSVVAPSTVIHARYLCTKLRARFPKLRIVVGLWGQTEDLAEGAKRLRNSGANEIVVSLAEALLHLAKSSTPIEEAMTPGPIPNGEEERLAALATVNLLDTEPERAFDRIVLKLVSSFDVPNALITLVDRERTFFKSQTGLPENLVAKREIPRALSFCGHVIAANELLVAEDLARDRRFANNPLRKELGWRFYAGAPVHAPGGQPIGSVCILDIKPREFSAKDRRLLQLIAEDVTEEIAKRALQTRRGDTPAENGVATKVAPVLGTKLPDSLG